MNTIQLSKDNIDCEHICCAFSDKKCNQGYLAKKEWLKNNFEDGYVFKKADARAKVFIEYTPAENAWAPIDAPGYMFIDCFWVSGQYKGKGLGKELFNECLKDSKDKNGIVVITGDKKRPFLSDPKFFKHLGFEKCDSALPYFELWHLKLKGNTNSPKFKDCVKNPELPKHEGLTIYYSNACPFTDYYVNVELANIAKSKDIPLVICHLDSKEKAQNHIIPFTIYSLFYNGKFITHEILSAGRFEKLIK